MSYDEGLTPKKKRASNPDSDIPWSYFLMVVMALGVITVIAVITLLPEFRTHG